MEKVIEETQRHIENVIETTYKIIQSVYENQQENNPPKTNMTAPQSRIIFPKYRNGKTRFSEQELRFVFVEQLNKEISKGWNVYYSIETPTSKKYKFKDEKKPIVINDNDKGGQSAQFDLVIHDSNYNRIALIEFKANNASVEHHEKDFFKLSNEGSNKVLTYFLEIVKSSDNGTSNNLLEKKRNFRGNFRCWSCEKKGYII